MSALVEPHRPWLIESLPLEATPSYPGWLADLIGEPPEPVASELKSRDFLFLTEEAIGDRSEVMAAAEHVIDQEPSVSAVVRAVVAEIYLLGAREEYDVSHSEPRWPGWIFVSAPPAAGLVSGLRLAENVLHETMHLQLSELEARIPLVADTASKLYSPWKQEPRQLQGILHGLYVCACISAYFRDLLSAGEIAQEGIGHVRRRIDSIGEEVASVAIDSLRHGLTEAGKGFLESISRAERRLCRP
ncbi:MAG TPA: HEXXH motif-containing putative peptide modification protein [Allosphingosinicella sp.]|nr:HEXXH motif-containing putative peptide modification protein [Allosphingosinicella sp.]